MKQAELASWLRIIILIAALIGILLCFLIAPLVGKQVTVIEPALSQIFWPFLLFIWLTAIPFFLALWQCLKIIRNVAADNSFCQANARSLTLISRLALVECAFYVAAAATLAIANIFYPGFMVMIVVIIFCAIAITMAAAMLSHLVLKASLMKAEQDLTV